MIKVPQMMEGQGETRREGQGKVVSGGEWGIHLWALNGK